MVLIDIGAVKTLAGMDWHGWQIVINVLIAIIILITTVIFLLYMLVLLGAANDIEHEKDRDYVINVFSGLVSVAALIVAIVALLNKNG